MQSSLTCTCIIEYSINGKGSQYNNTSQLNRPIRSFIHSESQLDLTVHLLPQAVIWDIRHCSLVRRLEGHQGAVFAVDLDNPARVAFTASGDKVCSYLL